MIEVWKTIESVEVSDLGNVRRDGKPKSLCLTGKYAKVGRGYLATKINGKLLKVHRLVAKAFIPNPDNLPEVNHKNGVTTDNRLENLEWISSSGNQLHAIHTGLRMIKRGAQIVTAVLTKEQASLCLLMLSDGISQRKIAKSLGISKTQVGRISRGESWKHLARTS